MGIYDFFRQTEEIFKPEKPKNIFPLKTEEEEKPRKKTKEDDKNLFQKNNASYQKGNNGIGNSNFALNTDKKPSAPKKKETTPKISQGGMNTNAATIPRNQPPPSKADKPAKETSKETDWSPGKSFAYGSERLGQGVLGAVEGVSDFINVGIGKPLQWITSLGGYAPNAVSDAIGEYSDNALRDNLTGQYGKNIRERYKPTEEMETLTGMNELAGNLMPGMFSAGVVSYPMLGQTVNTLMTAGQAVQNGYQQSGDLDQAAIYGSLYGGAEAIVSRLAGGIPLLPKGKLTQIVSDVIKDPTVAKGLQMAVDAIGEGGEDMFMRTLDPYIKRATIDANAPNASAEEILGAGLRAAALSMILQAGGKVTDKISQTNQFNRYENGRDMFLEGFYWIDDPEGPRVFHSKNERDFYEAFTELDNQKTASYYGKGAREFINSLGNDSDVRVLTHVPTSKARIYTTPGKTTTIIGRYDPDMFSILEELQYEKSLDFGPREGGFNLLNTPDELYKTPEQFWNEYNRPWLDQVIQRGDIIVLATLPKKKNLKRYNNKTGKFELNGFGREYNYLLEHGYVYDQNTRTMRLENE